MIMLWYTDNTNAFTLMTAAAVEARVVIALDDTSVSVYWNSLIIPDFDIDNYTVVYYQMNSQTPEDREMTAVFPGSSTSAIITDLDPDLSYQFQVFATVGVAGQSLEGERSFPPLQPLSEELNTSQSISQFRDHTTLCGGCVHTD